MLICLSKDIRLSLRQCICLVYMKIVHGTGAYEISMHFQILDANKLQITKYNNKFKNFKRKNNSKV